jgi:hypothetical protein
MTEISSAFDFLVRRDDLHETKFAAADDPDSIELSTGQILVAIDKFGFSANNITYATLGDAMNYWNFFPGPQGWGRVPVWGFADVVRSSNDAVSESERLFGYLPMSTHLVLEPTNITSTSLEDGAPHRAELPGVYQRYGRVSLDPKHDPEREEQQALWQPLFMTSFGAADFLVDNDLFGGKAVVFSSASSKTALGTAFLLHQTGTAQGNLIALTSPANVSFCEQLGYYDKVVAYEKVDSLDADTPTVYVDLAGNENVLRALKNHLGQSLKHTVVIGATHWDQRATGVGLGDGQSTFFFLPPWLEKRRSEWGPGEFGKRYSDAQRAFFPSVDSWMKIVHGVGPEAVEAVYHETLDGKVAPEVGHILSLVES